MRAVSDDARYLMLYLLTSPHRNIIGFYYLPSPYACFDLGWDEKRFIKGLQELIQKGPINYDPNVHVVLVKNYLKHNPLENPNQVKSAIEKLNDIPQTPLFQEFLEVVEQNDKPFTKPLIERLRERLAQPGTGTGSVTGSGSIYIFSRSLNGCENQPSTESADIDDSDTVPVDHLKDIFDHWNAQKIIVHKHLSDKVKRKIKSALKVRSPDEIKTAISNYAEIVHSPDHYFEYRWTLADFLQRGIDKFEDRDIALSNYRKGGVIHGHGTGIPGRTSQEVLYREEERENPDAWRIRKPTGPVPGSNTGTPGNASDRGNGSREPPDGLAY